MDERRYAIYFVPEANSDLYRFGVGVLGYDCYAGKDVPHDSGFDGPDWGEITREPRRYGFHATLKAPFRLLPPATEADLAEQLRRFVARPRTPAVITPAIRSIGGFIAIVPSEPCPEVDRLASDCVTAFDGFRRPPTPEERRKRLAGSLSARQIDNLDRWGYPYVFDDFRFHMTLTGPVAADRRGAIVTRLQARFDGINGRRALAITRAVLMRQDDPSAPFRVVCEAELNAAR
jgi:putative phosphonate metabolism protein